MSELVEISERKIIRTFYTVKLKTDKIAKVLKDALKEIPDNAILVEIEDNYGYDKSGSVIELEYGQLIFVKENKVED